MAPERKLTIGLGGWLKRNGGNLKFYQEVARTLSRYNVESPTLWATQSTAKENNVQKRWEIISSCHGIIGDFSEATAADWVDVGLALSNEVPVLAFTAEGSHNPVLAGYTDHPLLASASYYPGRHLLEMDPFINKRTAQFIEEVKMWKRHNELGEKELAANIFLKPEVETTITNGPLKIDLITRRVYVGAEFIDLGPGVSYRFLEYTAQRIGRIILNQELADWVWPPEIERSEDRNLRYIASRLRSVLGTASKAIVTEPEVGYGMFILGRAILTPPERTRSRPKILIGDVEIDYKKRLVVKRNAVLDLTPTELKLVMGLAQKPGFVYDRAKILEYMWGKGFKDLHQRLNKLVFNTIQKIGKGIIVSQKGVGYGIQKVPAA